MFVLNISNFDVWNDVESSPSKIFCQSYAQNTPLTQAFNHLTPLTLPITSFPIHAFLTWRL